MAPLTNESVWLDARGAQSLSHGKRGVQRMVAEQVRALIEAQPDLVGTVGIDSTLPLPELLEGVVGGQVRSAHTTSKPQNSELPAIYHVMSPFEMPLLIDEIWPLWAREADCRLVTTLLDLIPLLMREEYLEAWGNHSTIWISRVGLIGAADQVLTISQQTADDAAELLHIPEERLTVIETGVSDHFARLVGSRSEAESIVRAEQRKIRPSFLLYVGGVDYRKNLEGTIRAYAQLPEPLRRDHQLVIACELGIVRSLELKQFARELGIEANELVLTGFVPDRVLAALYRSCELFIYPSLYEGAGLPVLEAMSCDAPVIASGVSSMPELLGDLEGTFDPADPGDIARSIREALEAEGRLDALRERSRRRAALYTWQRVAERMIDGYERAMELPARGRGVALRK